MPIISFASSKGGAGKTTSAIVLATTLARRHKVVLVDADPAGRLRSWASKAPLPGRLSVQATQGERFIQEELLAAEDQADFVIVDLEGAATRLNAIAISESDLVIVPMGDEQQDAEAAIETLAQVALESQGGRREIPVRVLFARTQAAVKSRLARSLNAQVRDRVGSFQTELHNRAAISWLHNLGGTLYDMNPEEVTGVARAIANAELFAEELEKLMAWLAAARRVGERQQAKRKGETHA